MLRSGLVAGLAGGAGCIGGPTSEEQVDQARGALEKYTDVETALEEGYVTLAKYVRNREGEGGLGIPFVNFDAPALDEQRPQVLFYDLTSTGTYELMGAEWYVPADNNSSPPSLFGKEFHGPQPGHAPNQPRHYGLHVWAFTETDELFARYNPALTPPLFLDTLVSIRDRLRPFHIGAQALKNGYRNTEKCIALPDGGFGVPYVDTEMESTTDPTRPPLLLYRLTSSWNYILMGAEWYVPASEAKSPPTMLGQSFHEPISGHSPKVDQPEHYGLHAWLFRANPRGMFALSHPGVTC